MALRAEQFHAAVFRHAEFYAQHLERIHATFAGGAGDIATAIQLLDEHWSQINISFARLAKNTDDPVAQSLIGQYIRSGADVMYIRRPLQERLDWLQTGLSLADRLGDEALQLYCGNKLGQTYVMSRDLEQGEMAYETALPLARRLGDKRTEAQIMGGLGRIHSLASRTFSQAHAELTASRALFYDLRDLDGYARACHDLSVFEQKRGNFDEAQTYAEEALEIFEQTRNHLQIGLVLSNLGSIAEYRGDYDRSMEYGLRALDLGERNNDLQTVARARNLLGLVCDLRGDKEQATSHFEEALTLSYRIGNRFYMVAALVNLGWLSFGAQQYDQARHYYEQTVALYQQMKYKGRVSEVLCDIAAVLIIQGDYLLARYKLREAIEIALDQQTLRTLVVACLQLAWVALREGDAHVCIRVTASLKTMPEGVEAAQSLEHGEYFRIVEQEINDAFSPDERSTIQAESQQMSDIMFWINHFWPQLANLP